MEITVGMASRCRRLAEPRWTADSQAVLCLDSFDGRGDLVRFDLDGGPPLTLTAEPGPLPSASYGGGAYAVCPNGGSLAYVAKDKQLWSLPDRGGAPRQITKGHAAVSAPAFSPDGAQLAFILTDIDSQEIAITEVAGPGWPDRISAGAAFNFDPCWSRDGSIAWHEWDPPNMAWDGSRIRLRRADGAVLLVDGADEVSVAQPRFAPAGEERLAYLCDRTGWLNLWLYDASSGEKRHLVAEQAEHGRPTWAPGAQAFCWSPDGNQLAFVRVADQGSAIRIVAVESGEVREVGPQEGSVGGVAWSPDGRHLAYTYSDPRTPPQLLVTEVAAGDTRCLAHSAPGGFHEVELPQGEVISWPTAGGETAHGVLFRPDGVDNPPLLVSVHGGPTSQAERAWNSTLAYFISRGWAALVVNYRGSTGHGRAYAQALRGNWGLHDVDDSVSGARYVGEQGWADAARAAVMGGSAGGWTVLCCLARAPDAFAAGVNLFGVSDLVKFAPETHRFEAHYLDTLVGSLPESYGLYVDRSPVNMVDQIRKPLLILQGEDDVVVPPNQSQDIHDALKANGVPVEMKIYAGEGHGWSKVETIADHLERIEKFLNHHVLHRL